MSKHTKEPWRTDAPSGFPGDVMAGKEMIARTTITDQSNAKANARRIVACVNACDGIPTDELERKGLPLYMHETLTEQRDELLAAGADDIRAAGWAVAVHNDYRLNGIQHTFWLFTKDGVAVKGEGRTDAFALNQVRAAIKRTEES